MTTIRCDISTNEGQAVAGYITDSAHGLIGQFPMDGDGYAGMVIDESGNHWHNGPGLEAADEVLHARGYQRITEWEEGEDGCWSAQVKPLGEIYGTE